ncbi:MAG: hypothetical protein ACR2F8_07855 [Caulobacteraceae bacterium]
MTGAILAALGATQGAGGGGDVTPGPLDWTDAFGGVFAHTNSQTIAETSVPISLAASQSGGGLLEVTVNGSSREYVGASRSPPATA